MALPFSCLELPSVCCLCVVVARRVRARARVCYHGVGMRRCVCVWCVRAVCACVCPTSVGVEYVLGVREGGESGNFFLVHAHSGGKACACAREGVPPRLSSLEIIVSFMLTPAARRATPSDRWVRASWRRGCDFSFFYTVLCGAGRGDVARVGRRGVRTI